MDVDSAASSAPAVPSDMAELLHMFVASAGDSTTCTFTEDTAIKYMYAGSIKMLFERGLLESPALYHGRPLGW